MIFALYFTFFKTWKLKHAEQDFYQFFMSPRPCNFTSVCSCWNARGHGSQRTASSAVQLSYFFLKANRVFYRLELLNWLGWLTEPRDCLGPLFLIINIYHHTQLFLHIGSVDQTQDLVLAYTACPS